MIPHFDLSSYLLKYITTQDPWTLSAADVKGVIEEKYGISLDGQERTIVRYLSSSLRSKIFGNMCQWPRRIAASQNNEDHGFTENAVKELTSTWRPPNVQRIDPTTPVSPAECEEKEVPAERESKRLRRCDDRPDQKVLSEDIIKFFGTGEKEMLPSRAKERVWLYITQKKLDHGLHVKCDWKLEKLFGRSFFTKDEIPTLLEQHFVAP